MSFRKKSIFLVFATTIICFLLSNSPHISNIQKNSQAFIPCSPSLKSAGDIETSKFVYLTFDDGPTYVVTDALLDVLKKQNVKATFFIVGKEIQGKESILKRIYNEGHGIGLHTYSHNFKKIYRSTDEFIYEMKKDSNKIEEVTGFAPKVIRFPGGSAKRLNASNLEKLHKNNFKVYDWNVNLSDGINPNLSVSQLIKNSKIIKGNKNVAILLMHCNFNNKNTVKALPEIIKYYLDSGYEFKVITEDTPEYYYKFRD
ncbi:polysaccharide deacetylase [Clostridium sp. CF011]|uniref:polysaccharide deacetylase family protein n=1 Tax=unclassified Clostridium TaxID=2614128 RepID=UPI001C0B86BC|nr:MULTISPECIES: polysaccharide deacetylase family protein [unclassified Clostridium]MBU3093158.1 polysaccharide deacetylase [Clostridium sp. CF011]MBW9147078.1 polysaccharide deacetylase [Clostridium sp. CM027]UVE39574.1 polysaccharide deacetylase [Clostridium sp. CM027]WAG68479.1 polysaccharide deacetylase [Clostridium sp. CF011]